MPVPRRMLQDYGGYLGVPNYEKCSCLYERETTIVAWPCVGDFKRSQATSGSDNPRIL